MDILYSQFFNQFHPAAFSDISICDQRRERQSPGGVSTGPYDGKYPVQTEGFLLSI